MAIFYLVTASHHYTMNAYLGQAWGQAFRERVRIVDYEALPSLSDFPDGSYVFSDIDRLTPEQKAAATRAWATLSHGGRATRLLNDPARVLCRYELLQRMYDLGVNRFRAVRADMDVDLRFPVFLREEVGHTGSRTVLIYNRTDLETAKYTLMAKGFRLRDLLIVEFCDTADRLGRFRKYSAFIVGEEIIPRYLTLSHAWMVKYKRMIVDEAAVREELDYMAQNPHRQWLQEIFRIAHVDYGRIDYAVLDGAPQVWEINLNPMIGAPSGGDPPSAERQRQQQLRLPITKLFYERFARALDQLAGAIAAPPSDQCPRPAE